MYNPITDNDLKQKEYLSLLENVDLSLFEGYNVKQILFNETIYCLAVSMKELIKTTVKSLFFKKYTLDCKLNDNNILLFYSKNYRLDHDGYWEKIKKDVKEFDSITILIADKKKIEIKRIAYKVRYLRKSFKELNVINNIKDRWYLSVKLVDRKIVLDEIEALDISPKIVMCYSDNSPDENVIMQYFKKRSAVTVTNQHGLCVFQSCDYDRLNQSQILNFKCDYFLARGEKQKEQFVLAGYEPTRIKVVGFVDGLNEEIPIQSTNCVGIYLDCPTIPLSEINNLIMIDYGKEIAKRLGMKYLIKCHPQDSIDRYYQLTDNHCIGIYGKETSLSETFRNVDVCIVHASATYVDVYMYGLRCLKMNSAIKYPIAVNEDEFETVECAIDKIKMWKLLGEHEKRNYIQSVRNAYASPWRAGNINRVLQKILDKRG